MSTAELQALFSPAAPVPPAEQELRDWLKLCASILADRTPTEVAYLAIIGGFEPTVVYSTLCYFQDAMNGTHVDNRAAFQAFRLSMAIQDFQSKRAALEYVKELDLRPLWEDLILYQTGEVVTLEKGA